MPQIRRNPRPVGILCLDGRLPCRHVIGGVEAYVHYHQGGYFQPRFGLALLAVVKVAQTVGFAAAFADKTGIQCRHFFRSGGDYLGVADSVELDKIQLFAEPAAVGLFRQAAVAAQVGVVGPAPKTQQANQQHPEIFFAILTAWTFFLKSFLVVTWLSFWAVGDIASFSTIFPKTVRSIGFR